MDLVSLGADDAVFCAFEPWAARGLALARVITCHRDLYRLYAEAGEFEAEPSGTLWHRTPDRSGMPVTGDWVAARPINSTDAIVEGVLPRRTLFSRRAAGRREDQQPVAANIDFVFLVCGLDGDFNLRRLERYLALVVESRSTAVIVLNKSDLCANATAHAAEARTIAGGAPVVVGSAREPEGLAQLRGYLAHGRTVALLGSSGAGKSTIANRLAGQELLRTGEVRQSDGRGRHTTTHRELIPLPGGGALIDTPGMRELQLWAGEDSIERAFDEIAGLAAGCRYRDCAHEGEPGCAVRRAIEEGRLDAARFASYRKLKGEARRHELLADPLAAREQKRRWKIIHKAMRK